MSKIVAATHKIDYKGIQILESLCQNIGFLFREQREKDYGIDGEIELLKDSNRLEHVFKVQVKSTEKLKKVGEKYKIRAIKRDDLIYWNNDINIPVFIIAVEINTQKVYWVDTREYYQKIKKDKVLQSTTVYVNKNNELNLVNKEKFIHFTKELNIFNSKKELIKGSRSERTRIIAKEKGYQVLEQKFGNQNKIQLIPTENSKEDPVNGSFSFVKNLGNNKFSVNNFEFKIGDELIDTFSDGTIEILEYLEEAELYLSTLNHEYKVKVSKKRNQNEIIIKSLDSEILYLYLIIDLETGKSNLELNIKFLKLDTLQELSEILTFFIEIKDGLKISVINDKGKKNTLVGGKIKLETSSLSNIFVEYIHLLHKISMKFDFEVNLDELLNYKLSDTEIYNLLPYLYSIVEGKYISKEESILSVNITDKKQNIPDTELCIRFIFGEYEIFGHKIPLDIYVEGKGVIEENDGKYLMRTNELLFYSQLKNNN